MGVRTGPYTYATASFDPALENDPRLEELRLTRMALFTPFTGGANGDTYFTIIQNAHDIPTVVRTLVEIFAMCNAKSTTGRPLKFSATIFTANVMDGAVADTLEDIAFDAHAISKRGSLCCHESLLKEVVTALPGALITDSKALNLEGTLAKQLVSGNMVTIDVWELLSRSNVNSIILGSSLFVPLRVQVTSGVRELIREIQADPSLTRGLRPRQVEELVAELISDLGYEVHLTSQTRDGGRDIVAFSRQAASPLMGEEK